MINNYFLYKNLPTIDLHGEDRITSVIKVKEFINDNYKLGNKLIVIVHGKGKYILKDEIHKHLRTNKLVLNYKIDIFNNGATIVELK